jgi:23S rRNA G2069 N7-methylase RlmK/C1962 C5-methylase RlmI
LGKGGAQEVTNADAKKKSLSLGQTGYAPNQTAHLQHLPDCFSISCPAGSEHKSFLTKDY